MMKNGDGETLWAVDTISSTNSWSIFPPGMGKISLSNLGGKNLFEPTKRDSNRAGKEWLLFTCEDPKT